MVAVGEHYRPTEAEIRSGVYRVVGARGDVTLLRVADERGRRRHTGTVVHVSRSTLETGFEPADDPDAGISPLGAVRNALQGTYWSVHRFL